MAPGVRRTGHPGALRAGSTAAGGRWRDAGCWRSRWRSTAAGMLLFAGMMLLLVRCTSAEEKSTYDASGSSYLLSEPTATTAHPSPDRSSSDVVPFSVARSDGDSGPEGEGLSGQPAFSSVLTVVAGTIKAPVSATDNRTSPTITRGDTLTTQWPSHSYSQESEGSMLSGATAESTGQTSGMPRHHTTTAVALTLSSPTTAENMKDSSILSQLSTSTPSSSSLWNVSSFHGKQFVSNTDSRTERNTKATFLGLKATQTAFQPEGLSNKTSTTVYKSTTNEENHGGDGTYSSGLLSRTRQSIKYDDVASTHSLSSTQTQGFGDNGVSITSFPFHQESQAVQRQLGDLRNPKSADPKSSFGSGHGPEQMLNSITYMANKTAESSRTSFHKNAIKPSHHVISSTAPTLFTVPSQIGDTSLSGTTIDSGTVFLDQATNSGDLPVAPGHRGSAPDIDINYSQTKMAELKSISSEAHPNILPSLTSSSPGSHTNSLLRFITRHRSTMSPPETGSTHFTGNNVINEHQPGLSESRTQKQDGEGQKTFDYSTTALVLSPDTIRKVVPLEINYPYRAATSITTPQQKPFQTISTPFGHKVHETAPNKTAAASPAEIASDQTGPKVKMLSNSSFLFTDQGTSPEKVSSGPSFLAAEDVFKLYGGSTTPRKEAPAVTLEVGVEILKGRPRKNGTTLADSSDPSYSSRPEITQMFYFPRSLAPITSVSGDKSRFYSDSRAIMPATISSAAAEQKGAERLSAIYSFGTEIMAPYTKWKASKPDSFQSSVFASQKNSVGFDTTNSNLQADGPTYKDLKLEDGQRPDAANSTELKVTMGGFIKMTAESEMPPNTIRRDIRQVDLGDELSTNQAPAEVTPLRSHHLATVDLKIPEVLLSSTSLVQRPLQEVVSAGTTLSTASSIPTDPASLLSGSPIVKSASVSNTASFNGLTSRSAIQTRYAVDTTDTLSFNQARISATQTTTSSSNRHLPTPNSNDVKTFVPTSFKPYSPLALRSDGIAQISDTSSVTFGPNQLATTQTVQRATDTLANKQSELRPSQAPTDLSPSTKVVSAGMNLPNNPTLEPSSPNTVDSFPDAYTKPTSLPENLSTDDFTSNPDSFRYQIETSTNGSDNANQPSITQADAAQSGFDTTDTLSNTLTPALMAAPSSSVPYSSTSGDIEAADLSSAAALLSTSMSLNLQLDNSASRNPFNFSTLLAIASEPSSFRDVSTSSASVSEQQRFDLSPPRSGSTVRNQLNIAESDANAVLNNPTSPRMKMSSFQTVSDVTAEDFTPSEAFSPSPSTSSLLPELSSESTSGINNPAIDPSLSVSTELDLFQHVQTSTTSMFGNTTLNLSQLAPASNPHDKATASGSDGLLDLVATGRTSLATESVNWLSSTHAELDSLANNLAPGEVMTSSSIPILSTFSNLTKMESTTSEARSASTSSSSSNSISSLKIHSASTTMCNEQSPRLPVSSNLCSLKDRAAETETATDSKQSSLSLARLVSASNLHNASTGSHHVPTFSTNSALSNSQMSSSSSSSSLSSSSSSSSSSVSLLSSLFHSRGTLSPHPTTSTKAGPNFTPSPYPEHTQKVTATFFIPTASEQGELTTRTTRILPPRLPKEKESSLTPSLSAGATLTEAPAERTSQVSALTPHEDTTTASVMVTSTTVASTTKTTNPSTSMPFVGVTPETTRSTTTTTQPFTRRATTTRRTFTPHIPRTISPRVATTIFISPFTTTTESPPQQCNITERMWLRTVVSIYVRRNRLDSIQRQNLRRGLTQGLRKALNDSSAQAQMETVFGSPNMTVAYHVTGGDMVYPPSVVLDGLDAYGRDKLIADLRQYLPLVTALPIPVALWRPSPANGYQLKTVLQFVGAGDDPRSCRFFQMMEQRLEKVFAEAQSRVLHTSSRLSVQMLSVTQARSSPAVSLVYAVKNGTAFLNGTTASNLLRRLSAELVGYFLFYPPLVISEPLEYHNLNTSIATRDYWVMTVILDVEDSSLEAQYQSFASLMEQRLAELFVWAGQHGTRFKRATSVESYTVQMVSIRRVSGLKNPAEMTYYIQHKGAPLLGTSAAKVLNTVDSQTMALTLGYFVQLQAEPVVKNPPNNLWIIAAVLAPIAVVTLIIIIITAVLCRKNKNDFKSDAIGNLNPRAKMAYRRDVGYYHQPVQGFDYAKQHLGQQGGDEETLPASQDTLMMSLQIRDKPLSLEKVLQQEGSVNKKNLSADKKHKSKLPSDDGSVISNESEKLNSSRGLTAPKVTAQQKPTKEEKHKRDDSYDSSSGSLQLVSIKPLMAQHNYLHPASSDRIYDSAIVNGEVNISLKQKSDVDHYRNKLRIKGKRKGYYDFPVVDGSVGGLASSRREQNCYERVVCENSRGLEPEDERSSTYVKSNSRHSQVGQMAYRSRQSLSSPSPGGTEMDLLVMRERPRKGIRNSGYDTEPELIQETNVDRLVGQRGQMFGRGLKGHSETSTLSSQPSIDEVRQQMHLLLEEAFTLASGGQSTSGRHHNHHPRPDPYSQEPPPFSYSDVVSSTPGTMSCGGLQWVPSYGSDVYSLPKPAFRFTQLPDMSPPPPLPPRSGPPPGKSLRRSTSDLGPKSRCSETAIVELDKNPYGLSKRATLSSISAEPPLTNYSGNPITAVYAIPASRTGYSDYVVSTPPTSYHSPSWMSYPPEPEVVTPQWADAVPLPGYVEAFPHPRYPQGSPPRLPLQYNHTLEQKHSSSTDQPNLKDVDGLNLSSLTTSALVQAIRQEVAKLAKKQNDMFDF